MAQDTTYMQITLPKEYAFRYTIDYLIRLHATTSGMAIMDVQDEILALLEANEIGMKKSMMYNYRNETQDSDREAMSEERMHVLAEYFGVEIEMLITENVIIPRK